MISRLKRKVIILISVSLLSLLILIVAGMNIISFISLQNESDEILSFISDSGGKFPEMPQNRRDNDDKEEKQLPKDFLRRFTPEMQFETRYFSVVLTSSGNTVRIDTGRIAAVDTDEAEEYAKAVLSAGKVKGFKGNYRYSVTDEDDNKLITFLDRTRELESFKTFLLSSIIVSFSVFAVVLVIIIIVSGRIIRPIAESYEKQKRFITDASHELRTPLAIINANVDVIDDEVEDKECISDIRLQTERLKLLTEDLVTLSRMEEGSAAIIKEPFSASETALDTANGFKALTEQKNIDYSVSVAEGITLKGDKKAFSKLLSILLDNAVKYTPEGGTIDLSLSIKGKSAVVSCSNTTADEMSREDISHVFDRFYRTDKSRNSALGGHGIGLSVAKAIAEAHSGRITAQAADAHTFLITAVFPL
ncbi:MAG: HAMP domain-containing histidine kinase [Clostridia bacterium]|nr:HAMP domain-containing histidine kinase [Clostridia bacterium]